jgi:hypothetical protein
VAADVGNLLHINSGTNWTAGWYQIVSAAGNNATLDKACGSSASLTSGTYHVGGALRNPGIIATLPLVAGNVIYISGSFAEP